MGDARTQRDSAHPAPLAGRAAHSNTRHIYAVRLLGISGEVNVTPNQDAEYFFRSRAKLPRSEDTNSPN